MKIIQSITMMLGAAAMSACGGSGGASTPSAGSVTANVVLASVAPVLSPALASLVVPSTMKWNSVSMPAFQFSVKNSAGALVPNALVSLYTYTDKGPYEDYTLDEPVALDLLDQVITDANGVASISARLPGYLSSILVVSTKGGEASKQVVVIDSPAKSVDVQLNP